MGHRSVEVIIPGNGTDGEGGRGDGRHVEAVGGGFAGTRAGGGRTLENKAG